jgi:hypothetical protein
MSLEAIAEALDLIADNPPNSGDPYEDSKAQVETMIGLLKGAQ